MMTPADIAHMHRVNAILCTLGPAMSADDIDYSDSQAAWEREVTDYIKTRREYRDLQEQIDAAETLWADAEERDLPVQVRALADSIATLESRQAALLDPESEYFCDCAQDLLEREDERADPYLSRGLSPHMFI